MKAGTFTTRPRVTRTAVTSSLAGSARTATPTRTALSFGVLPELPRSEPNPAYPDTTGYSQYTVPGTHATIQLAIDAAIDDIDGSGNFKGAEIVLAAGGTTTITTTLVGKKLTVPNPNSKYIIIRTSNLAGLPAPDTPWHTSPITNYLAAMHKIQTASTMPKTGSSSVLFKTQTDTDAGWYRFVGIELTVQTASTALSRLLELGSDAVTSIANQAHHIGIDRCYLHGHDNCSVQRGIVMNCYASFCVDSTLAEFWSLGADAQAINGVNGGPGDDPAGREGVLIRNNRLEGSGENIMLGGGGTLHMDLLPADWTIERNYFVKPIAWRSSVIPAPTITSQSLVAGGTLTIGTSYQWAIAARGLWADSSGSVTGENVKTSVFVPTSGNQSVSLTWGEVLISTTSPHRPVEYRIYESQDGGASWVKYYTVADTGASSYMITVNGSNAFTAATSIARTRRVVKNIFELKIGTRVDINGNLFENCWADGQEGYAFKVTISNGSTSRPLLSVSHNTIRNNVIRHCGQGLNILGTDSFTSRTPVHTIAFVNNLWEDISATNWAGPGYAIYTHGSSVTDRLKQQPHNIHFVHNTFINPEASFLRIDDDEPPFVVPGHNWIIHSNIAHYGAFGVANTDNFIDAEDALDTNFINLLFARNVLGSGGSGSAFGAYAANNAFPQTANLGGVGFIDYDASYPYPPTENQCLHNFRLSGASAYLKYALDGGPCGADLDDIEAASGLDLTP